MKFEFQLSSKVMQVNTVLKLKKSMFMKEPILVQMNGLEKVFWMPIKLENRMNNYQMELATLGQMVMFQILQSQIRRQVM